MTRDRIRGALLGLAVGDALGMPVEGLSHSNVRTYYAGIKGFVDDEKRRDLRAGQWTDDTQFAFALVRALSTGGGDSDAVRQRAAREYVALLPEARRWGPTSRVAVERLAAGAGPATSGASANPSNGAAMRAAPLGVWWAATRSDRLTAMSMIRPVLGITHRHPAALTAGVAQAYAVMKALAIDLDALDRLSFWSDLIEFTIWTETALGEPERLNSKRLTLLADQLDEFPLDLGDLCGEIGVPAHESWPFAVAMFARHPELLEATLLSTINVGGDADTTGAMAGALLGAVHGWSAFPDAWRLGLEAVESLTKQADLLFDRLATAN
jgi:ADP-ribosyl-[dinitrogen reductase] hydrolase